MLDTETPPAAGRFQHLTTVPEGGEPRRAWIQMQLKMITNPKTDKGWTQADIADKAGASESMVSSVYTGRRQTGDLVEKIMKETAKVLKVPIDVLFGHTCTSCPRCGAPHPAKRFVPSVETTAD